MVIGIKGINTGVIRQKNEFITLALKIKEPRNKESLFFLSPLGPRDLLTTPESRLFIISQLNRDEHMQYEKTCDKANEKMHENIPLIQEDELKNADINRRINSLMLVNDKGKDLALPLVLHDGQTCELLANELQVQVLTHAITHVTDSTGMRELVLRITSLLNSLPLYDVDCQQNDSLEYDSYTQPEWEHNLFNHYLAIIYRYKDDKGKAQFYDSVVKTRALSGSKETEAITRRLLDLSLWLKKFADVSCQVFVRTLTGDKAQKFNQDQYLRVLHHLHVQSAHKTQST